MRDPVTQAFLPVFFSFNASNPSYVILCDAENRPRAVVVPGSLRPNAIRPAG